MPRRGNYREQYSDRRERLKAFIDFVKSDPCLDCGGRFPPVAMDLDHVRGVKRFGISEAWDVGRRALCEELQKCELVCANCHRIRTEVRRGAQDS